MDISLIVLNYNDARTTINMVNSVKQYNIINHIVIVDNMSTDDSYSLLKTIVDEKVTLIQSKKNGGYGYGNNFGIEYSHKKNNSDYYIISNPDVEVNEETIVNMLNVLSLKDEYVCASAIPYTSKAHIQKKYCWKIPTAYSAVFSTGKILQKFFRFDWLADDCCKDKKYIEVDCVPGSLLILKRNIVEQGKVYDENVFLYYEETILGHRIKDLGYKTVMVNDMYVHHHSVSINKSITSTVEQRRIMYKSVVYYIEHYLKPSRLTVLFCKTYLDLVIYENYLDGMISKLKGVISR